MKIVLLLFLSFSLLAQIEEKIVFGSEYFKHEENVPVVAACPNGKYFFSTEEKSILFWDPITGEKVRTITKLDYAVSAMAISPDSTKIAIEDSC